MTEDRIAFEVTGRLSYDEVIDWTPETTTELVEEIADAIEKCAKKHGWLGEQRLALGFELVVPRGSETASKEKLEPCSHTQPQP